jgi:hypothetical protein
MSDNNIEFSLDNIPKYLNDNKIKLINMNILLDRYEISKSLTISLDRMLMGNKTKLTDVYNLMITNFDDISNKIKLIEDKIQNFNSEQNFEYFIDPEKILYIVFFKQIDYIKNLINDIFNYIDSNINLVFIYSYLISKLYNEPNNITSNYIFILNNIISNSSLISNYDDRLKKFLEPKIIDKIFIIIKIIYNLDTDFEKLLIELNNKKMEEYKKNNKIDLSDTYKKFEENNTKIQGGSDNIYDIEKDFEKKKDILLFQKRNINISNVNIIENFNLIFKDEISIELWFGYNLFIYKRFIFDFKEYQTKINEVLNSNSYNKIYELNLNYLNDIDAPDAGILSNMNGGSNIYYLKYIKYKNKYLKLKKIN